MSNRSNYPYLEAIQDIRDFVEKYVIDMDEKKEIIDYLGICEKNKTVTFRYIHELIMNYRKRFDDYRVFSQSESKMIEDLMHFWG